MEGRILIHLNENEFQALREDAIKDLRPIQKQAHYLLRQELIRRGLLNPGKENQVQELQDSGKAVGCAA